MDNTNILQYFNENASKEEWDVVNKVYEHELLIDLKEIGMQNKKTFSLKELNIIYKTVALEKDLLHVMDVNNEIGCVTNEATKNMYIDDMKESLKEYEEEVNVY